MGDERFVNHRQIRSSHSYSSLSSSDEAALSYLQLSCPFPGYALAILAHV